ncbi:MAG: DUF5667 domain-containing protein [Patescibacteria group bacterium]
MNKSPFKQLKRFKHDPRFGGMDEAAKGASWAKIAAAIGVDDEPVEAPALQGVSYGVWLLTQYLSKPVLVGTFSVVVIASGWLTTVRASDSLPGDALYSVKKITEQAQLRLASLDRRAILHTEFAGRRLQEASDLQGESTNASESASLVHGAIEAYKQEISSAAASLRQLKDEGGVTTLATASSVQQNLQAIDTTIDAVVADSVSAEATQEALVAKEVTKVASEAATTVAVEVHEEEKTALSTYELKQMFKSELGQIEARQRFDLERIEVIRAALADESISYAGFTVPTSDELLAYEYPIVAVDSLLSQAMNSFAAGGFRSAFATLQEIDTSLLAIEAQLAQIEITIMNARTQPPAVVGEEAIEIEEPAKAEDVVL